MTDRAMYKRALASNIVVNPAWDYKERKHYAAAVGVMADALVAEDGVIAAAEVLVAEKRDEGYQKALKEARGHTLDAQNETARRGSELEVWQKRCKCLRSALADILNHGVTLPVEVEAIHTDDAYMDGYHYGLDCQRTFARDALEETKDES